MGLQRGIQLNLEKLGIPERSYNQTKKFWEALHNAVLKDLGYECDAFMFVNGRQGDGAIWERLDRFCSNEA